MEEQEREREKEKQQELERKEAEEKAIEERLERERENLREMRKIQDEILNLNRSLNECISIASASIMNIGLKKRYERMVEENHNSYIRSNQTIDNAMDDTRGRIHKLQEEKEEKQEEVKKEEKKQEEQENHVSDNTII